MKPGVLTVLDEAEDRGVDTCVTCPSLCRWSCPVAEAEARETSSPHRLVVLSGLMKKHRISATGAGTLPYHCTHCMACVEACLHDNDVPFLLSAARARIVSAGAAPPPVREVVGHFGVAGNPQGASLEPQLQEAAKAAGYEVSRGGDRVYFPGCATLDEAPDAAVGFLRTCSLSGVPDVTVRPASAACCGLPLYWAGELEAFRGHASRFVSQFEGVRELVVHDPACAHAIRVRYPQVGVTGAPRVRHVSEVLANGLKSGQAEVRSEGPEESRLAYADTCHLARGLDQVDAPRRLIMQRFEIRPVELPGLSGRAVDCCGAAGLLPLTAPETAQAMAQAKIEAFRATGAARLAVFSPRCGAHLRNTAPGLPVDDLATLLARA